jgi:hypothetical protein
MELTGWVSAEDGLLVHDLNNDGTINNISEIFSEYYNSNNDETTYQDSFAALSSIDSNNDNIFDSNDAEFNNIKIWQDLNQDGISQLEELKTLTQHNITSIKLGNNITPNNNDIRSGNEVTNTSYVTRNIDGNFQANEIVSVNFTTNPNGHNWQHEEEGFEAFNNDNYANENLSPDSSEYLISDKF